MPAGQTSSMSLEERHFVDSDNGKIQNVVLHRLFPESKVELKPLADLIVSQKYVGTVVRDYDCDEEPDDFDEENDDSDEEDSEEDEAGTKESNNETLQEKNKDDDVDPAEVEKENGEVEEDEYTDSEYDEWAGCYGGMFALVTVINIKAHKDDKCIKDLMLYLKDKYQHKLEAKEEGLNFRDLFRGQMGKVGWIIYGFRNLVSMQVLGAMFETLQEDIQKAVTRSLPFRFDKYLVIVKARIPNGGTLKDAIFDNNADEQFFKNSHASFCYARSAEVDPGEPKKDKSWKESFAVRVVMIVDPLVGNLLIHRFSHLLCDD